MQKDPMQPIPAIIAGFSVAAFLSAEFNIGAIIFDWQPTIHSAIYLSLLSIAISVAAINGKSK